MKLKPSSAMKSSSSPFASWGIRPLPPEYIQSMLKPYFVFMARSFFSCCSGFSITKNRLRVNRPGGIFCANSHNPLDKQARISDNKGKPNHAKKEIFS